MDHTDTVSTRHVHDSTLALAKELIACPSVTPEDSGCMDLIASRLTKSGFDFERMDRGKPVYRVRNLWARHGTEPPLVCLAGHIDVVPPGPIDRWISDPFQPTDRDGCLFGRGAADMKTAVAAMITAAERCVAATPDHKGSLALLLTSDEEGRAHDGTFAVVQQLHWRGETLDACIVGEPTCASMLGDTIKNGGRGVLNGVVIFNGVQRHIAYPERGPNAIHLAMPVLAELASMEWDEGDNRVPPTTFQMTHVQASTGASNTVPGSIEVWFSIRFSSESTQDELKRRILSVLDGHGVDYDLKWNLNGLPFLSEPGSLVETLRAAVTSVTGVTPQLSTAGDTSGGRFLSAISREVVEFGPVNTSIHAINEHVRLGDIAPLSEIYEQTIRSLLETGEGRA